MTDGSEAPSGIPIYTAFGAAILFAFVIFSPIHLAGWDHDVCFAVADQSRDIPRGILQYSFTEIFWGGLKRVTGFSVLGLIVWILAFSPFVAPAMASNSTAWRWVWLVFLLASGSFFLWQLGVDPSRYHDCDRKGLELVPIGLPLIVLALNAAFSGSAALIIWLVRKQVAE